MASNLAILLLRSIFCSLVVLFDHASLYNDIEQQQSRTSTLLAL
uniref:Uncharacterized protein n=1 Tax=Arundo donax TaxID=35708 RepID=A0A0A9AMF3_ARUDO